MARKVSIALLVILCLFLLGTTIVLSTTKIYLNIEDWAYITEDEVPYSAGKTNGTAEDIVPRILHQTWKTDILPEQWAGASEECRKMMPDYEYMLWTDAKSRQLIADYYPWFLSTFDGYKYNIQRADAIRYFVLHRYGGAYFDLDMGCVRPIDPLLKYQVILPKTKPVGVSNDLMLSTPGHPFFEQVIRGLISFDINYILNYPTVMFSTGPMFMSVQYGLYTASHPPTPENPGGEVRILPKSLYGKNSKPGEAPHAFFLHFYGSSWHSDDAWLWTFLGLWGMRLMYVAAFVAVIAGAKMYFFRKKGHGRGRRLMLGRYEVLLPRFHHDRESNAGRFDLGPFSMVVPNHSRDESGSSTALSTSSSEPTSPTATPRFPASMIPLSLDASPSSPTLSTTSSSGPEPNAVAGAFRSATAWVVGAVTGQTSNTTPSRRNSNAGRPSTRSRRRRPRGILFFLPAIFHPSRNALSPELESITLPPIDAEYDQHSSRTRSRSPMRLTKEQEAELESVPLMGDDRLSFSGSRRASMSGGPSSAAAPPPPYASSRLLAPGAAFNPPASTSTSNDSWESWGSRDEPR